ncbi:MAG: hypothetical protein H6818_06820 [Phycisphaerales bacterium]|nr:hypothetical protein [Phycisphaerales bacterium]MCB9864869.1 hypothetical protein [Phycisphaerales bacterium]
MAQQPFEKFHVRTFLVVDRHSAVEGCDDGQEQLSQQFPIAGQPLLYGAHQFVMLRPMLLDNQDDTGHHQVVLGKSQIRNEPLIASIELHELHQQVRSLNVGKLENRIPWFA